MLEAAVHIHHSPEKIEVSNHLVNVQFELHANDPARALTGWGYGQWHLVGAEHQAWHAKNHEIKVVHSNDLHTCVEQRVSYRCPASVAEINLRSRTHVIAGCAKIRCEVDIHNPAPAVHKNGLWDLGDPNAVYLQELAVRIPAPSGVNRWRVNYDELWSQCDTNLVVYQGASGGDNCHSRNHRDVTGSVPFDDTGFKVFINGALASEGRRAVPQVYRQGAHGSVGVWYPKFWQEFPSAIRTSADHIALALLPGEFPALHELQPGERKTFEFFIDYAMDEASFSSPPIVRLGQASYAASGWHTAAASTGNLALANRIDALLREGVEGPSSFMDKREVLDEYGWRNFGDVFGDHETGERPPNEFVSHYNNQYDLVFGFWRMWIDTGDARWLELHGDLARHVCDIDIYHTGGDREEYNNGLFWHTDHYVDAGLATHRSFFDRATRRCL